VNLWDGAAILYMGARYYVNRIEGARVYVAPDVWRDIDLVTLDLSHHPTLLEFIHRLAERLAKGQTWAVFHAYDGRVRFYLGDETVDFDGSEDEFLQAWEGA
jgi:hypothetical protein